MRSVLKWILFNRKRRNLITLGSLLSLLCIFGINAGVKNAPSIKNSLLGIEGKLTAIHDHRKIVTQYLSQSLLKNNFAPIVNTSMNGSTDNLKVLYTFDYELQKELDALLRQYGSDYASVVAMDPSTGKILAMASYEGGHPSNENWALKASFPAASIFKIVTASAAIEKYKVSPDMEMGYTGGNYKLYKRDLFNDNEKWARSITFKEAFARSINIFFGKLALKFMHGDDLMTYAKKFYFNKDLLGDMPAESGRALISSSDPFHVAEVASGYNNLNTLSPIHGALIASAIVNDGEMKSPYLVESLMKPDGTPVYKSMILSLESPISITTAKTLRDLMNETVEHGTSRKSFRELAQAKHFSMVEAGGKTGSLNGTNPKGKTDWFVGYARLGTRMLALSVVTVNKNYWKVKSSYIAQRLIRKHFKDEVILTSVRAENYSSSF